MFSGLTQSADGGPREERGVKRKTEEELRDERKKRKATELEYCAINAISRLVGPPTPPDSNPEMTVDSGPRRKRSYAIRRSARIAQQRMQQQKDDAEIQVVVLQDENDNEILFEHGIQVQAEEGNEVQVEDNSKVQAEHGIELQVEADVVGIQVVVLRDEDDNEILFEHDIQVQAEEGNEVQVEDNNEVQVGDNNQVQAEHGIELQDEADVVEIQFENDNEIQLEDDIQILYHRLNNEVEIIEIISID